MKLRIRGNSIRLRLSQSELVNLEESGMLEERTLFPGSGSNALVYRLIRSEQSSLSARYLNHSIEIGIPEKKLVDWANSELVGLNAELELEDGSLYLLIEKDFACLTDRVHEDDSDAFPNPNLSC